MVVELPRSPKALRLHKIVALDGIPDSTSPMWLWRTSVAKISESGDVLLFSGRSLRLFSSSASAGGTTPLNDKEFSAGELSSSIAASVSSGGRGGLSLTHWKRWAGGSGGPRPGNIRSATDAFWVADTVVVVDQYLVHRFLASGKPVGITPAVFAAEQESILTAGTSVAGRWLVATKQSVVPTGTTPKGRQVRTINIGSGALGPVLLELKPEDAGLSSSRAPDLPGVPAWYALTREHILVAADSGRAIDIFDRWGRPVRRLTFPAGQITSAGLITGILAAEDGSIAILRTPNETTTSALQNSQLMIVDGAGAVVGEIVLPLGFVPSDFTGRYLAGVTRTEEIAISRATSGLGSDIMLDNVTVYEIGK